MRIRRSTSVKGRETKKAKKSNSLKKGKKSNSLEDKPRRSFSMRLRRSRSVKSKEMGKVKRSNSLKDKKSEKRRRSNSISEKELKDKRHSDEKKDDKSKSKGASEIEEVSSTSTLKRVTANMREAADRLDAAASGAYNDTKDAFRDIKTAAAEDMDKAMSSVKENGRKFADEVDGAMEQLVAKSEEHFLPTSKQHLADSELEVISGKLKEG